MTSLLRRLFIATALTDREADLCVGPLGQWAMLGAGLVHSLEPSWPDVLLVPRRASVPMPCSVLRAIVPCVEGQNSLPI